MVVQNIGKDRSFVYDLTQNGELCAWEWALFHDLLRLSPSFSDLINLPPSLKGQEEKQGTMKEAGTFSWCKGRRTKVWWSREGGRQTPPSPLRNVKEGDLRHPLALREERKKWKKMEKNDKTKKKRGKWTRQKKRGGKKKKKKKRKRQDSVSVG